MSYWRDSDRTLICGDVFSNLNMLTGVPGLHEPPEMFSSDRRAITSRCGGWPSDGAAPVCFGHGPPLRDRSKLRQFTASLAA